MLCNSLLLDKNLFILEETIKTRDVPNGGETLPQTGAVEPRALGGP